VRVYQLGDMVDPRENTDGAAIVVPGPRKRGDRHNTREIG